jgi:hypothetical protein
MPKSKLYISIFVVIVLAGISFYTYLSGWETEFSLNFGTELTGILVTVLLIDLVIGRHEERENLKLRSLALRQLRTPLQRHLNLLLKIYKASRDKPSGHSITDHKTLFADDFYLQLARFDFSSEAPATPKMQWMDYIAHELSELKEALSGTLEKYAINLDSVAIEAVEAMLNSSFISFLGQVPNIRASDRASGISRKYVFLGAPGMDKMIRDHTENLSKLLNVYHSDIEVGGEVKISDNVWREDVAPKTGSARGSS